MSGEESGSRGMEPPGRLVEEPERRLTHWTVLARKTWFPLGTRRVHLLDNRPTPSPRSDPAGSSVPESPSSPGSSPPGKRSIELTL
jgi:hypothetical protein